MTENEFLEARIRSLENENRQLRESLVDKFAVALAPALFNAWMAEGTGHDLNARIWRFAENIVRARP